MTAFKPKPNQGKPLIHTTGSPGFASRSHVTGLCKSNGRLCLACSFCLKSDSSQALLGVRLALPVYDAFKYLEFAVET